MSNVPNELHDEFPEAVETIHRLKTTNAHFARLAGEYHDLNRAIHRADTDIEPTSDDHLEQMKRQRLFLKDQIADMLRHEKG